MQYCICAAIAQPALMQYNSHMDSYFETLNKIAVNHSVDLRTAFDHAGVPSSTFYRAQQRNDMRFVTALKVLKAIEMLHASQAASRD
jgi:predicted transcriptional regulator